MKNTEFKGQLKGFPKEVVLKMLERQEEQGNEQDVSIFEMDVCAGKDEGGFDWAGTVEGYGFWSSIVSNNFDVFFKKYPNKNKIGDIFNFDFVKEFFDELEKMADSKEKTEKTEKNNFYEEQIKELISKLETVKDYLQNKFETHTEFSEGVKYGKTSVITDILIDLNLILGQGQLKN